MMMLNVNGQIDGHWAPSHGLSVSNALPMLSIRLEGTFDLSASRQVGGYTSAL